MTDIVLLAGLWLPASVWDDVIGELRARGAHGVAVALPGQDDGNASATLTDQVDAALAAVDASEDPPLVVGHSAAAALAWAVADARPTGLAGVALIGGFPVADGGTYADFFPIQNGVMPFPGWAPFEGPEADDLDAAARARLEAMAVAVPEGVARGVVRLTDSGRYDVPVTLICPEFSPDDAQAWITKGDAPELAAVHSLRLVDLDSGHWPMISQPARLAELLVEAAR